MLLRAPFGKHPRDGYAPTRVQTRVDEPRYLERYLTNDRTRYRSETRPPWSHFLITGSRRHTVYSRCAATPPVASPPLRPAPLS